MSHPQPSTLTVPQGYKNAVRKCHKREPQKLLENLDSTTQEEQEDPAVKSSY